MTFPDCHVPSHADWKTLRAKNGGKSGLFKVNMGKKLDEFHKAVAARDLAKTRMAIKSMETYAKTYAAELAKKYSRVADAVTKNILQRL